jgi:DNA-binding NarL/FixJ family response regulator
MPIKVAIVDDDEGIRASLATLIRRAPALRLVGDYADAEAALKEIPHRPPDVVLMDINLPGVNGVECVRQLKSRLPGVQFLMLTVYEDSDSLFNSLQAGASGYLLKRSDPAKVLEAITDLHHGGAPMTDQIARKVIESFHQTRPAAHPQDKLTAREEEILDYLSKGYVTKEIADKLGITSATVRFHLKHIYDKLHVRSRVEAVIKHLG